MKPTFPPELIQEILSRPDVLVPGPGLVQGPWETMLATSRCPHCARTGCLEKTAPRLGSSAYLAAVRCTQCPYRDGFTSYIAKAAFPIEHLPNRAAVIYDRDPEVAALVSSSRPGEEP